MAQLISKQGSVATGCLLALCMAVSACSSKKTDNTTSGNTSSVTTSEQRWVAEVDSVEQAASSSESWEYSTTKDELTGKDIVLSARASDNTVTITNEDGEDQQVQGHLIFNNNPQDGTSLLFSVETGTFDCDPKDGCNLTVIFDNNGNVLNYTAYPMQQGDNNLLVIPKFDIFRLALQKVKTFKIQVNVKDNGRKVFEFTTDGYDISKTQ